MAESGDSFSAEMSTLPSPRQKTLDIASPPKRLSDVRSSDRHALLAVENVLALHLRFLETRVDEAVPLTEPSAANCAQFVSNARPRASETGTAKRRRRNDEHERERNNKSLQVLMIRSGHGAACAFFQKLCSFVWFFRGKRLCSSFSLDEDDQL